MKVLKPKTFESLESFECELGGRNRVRGYGET